MICRSRVFSGLSFALLVSAMMHCGGGNNTPGDGGSSRLVGLSVSPQAPAIPLGSTQQMSALGAYSDGSQQDLTNSVSWAVTQPQVVSVSTQGLLTSNKPGQSLLEAVFNGLGASTTVTVSDIQPISIQVTPSLATVFAGTGIQMQAISSFADAGTLDITRFAEWSAPPGLISITAGGLVSTPPLQQGTALVTAKYGSTTGTTSLNVTAGPDGIYIFRSPADTSGTPNFGNTVLVATTSPRLGTINQAPSFDPTSTIDINYVNVAGHTNPDVRFRATFAPPTPAGGDFNQVVTLRLIQGATTTTIAQYTFFSAQVVPPAAFANNVTFPGDAIATGKFWAGASDDPAFFDAVAGIQFLLLGTPLPRPNPADFFGPNGNCLSLVLQVPTVKLSTANPPVIGVWEDRLVNTTPVARTGHPFLPFFLLPPSDLAAYNQGTPATDVALFSSHAVAHLTAFPLGLTPALAQALASARLPDILRVDLSVLVSVYPNGRYLRDDVVDSLLNACTNGVVTSDGIADDNGTRITDGRLGTTVAFPYIGRPNNPPQ